MPAETPSGAPRHMAGSKRSERLPSHLLAGVDAVELADAEVLPKARVHRSRLAFAMSATVLALPILVLDNFPATADPGARGDVVVAETDGGEPLRPPVHAFEGLLDEGPAGDPTTTSVTFARAEPAEASVASARAAEPPEPEQPADQVPEQPAAAAGRAAAPAPASAPTTAPPAPAPAPAPSAPPPSSSTGDPDDPATWDRLAGCESDGNWALNTGNGYYGGLQFSLATWQEVGGAGYPHQASREEQIQRGRILQARYGWGQWPYCARQLGYR